ncbi:hypothetical protein K492DRAFT_172974 [Lichtheimia hyalospora FSU 10163]|nr:hypothetical protein K492DRAFT_172974 [Lichtheimia hyalospora FSU 10163]
MGTYSMGSKSICSPLTSITKIQQQHKAHGMEIELAQAKNGVEQHGKGFEGFCSVILLLAARQGYHCINLYCLMGDETFPSALAPSALVPNAITLRGLI